MRWSKLKKALEALLAETVKEHLQVHFTRYGRSPDTMMDRAWITWDQEEIHNFSTVSWLRANRSVATQVGEASEQKELPGWYDEEVAKQLEQLEVTSRQQWYEALQMYSSLSIEQAMHAPNALIRAWAMFDRRLGKRRLRSMQFTPTDPPFIQRWYQLRCQAEGISVRSAGHHHESA